MGRETPPRGGNRAEVLDLERLRQLRDFASAVDYVLMSVEGPMSAAVAKLREKGHMDETDEQILDQATRRAMAQIITAYRRQLGFTGEEWSRAIRIIDPMPPEEVTEWKKR